MPLVVVMVLTVKKDSPAPPPPHVLFTITYLPQEISMPEIVFVPYFQGQVTFRRVV